MFNDSLAYWSVRNETSCVRFSEAFSALSWVSVAPPAPPALLECVPAGYLSYRWLVVFSWCELVRLLVWKLTDILRSPLKHTCVLRISAAFSSSCITVLSQMVTFRSQLYNSPEWHNAKRDLRGSSIPVHPYTQRSCQGPEPCLVRLFLCASSLASGCSGRLRADSCGCV